MKLSEVTLRTRYEYPFIELSSTYPEVPVSMWCIWNRELLQVGSRDPKVLDGVERAIKKAGKVVDEWTDAYAGRLFMLHCTCDRYPSIWNLLDEYQCVDAPPSVFLGGWWNFRFLSFDETKTRDIVRALRARGPTELVSKRPLPLAVLPTSVWAHSLFGGLTQRQVDAVLQAHRLGYYSSPRSITTEDISRSVGVSRSTYEEHLRKAENRLVSALVPYLQLYHASDYPTEKLPTRESPLVAAELYEASAAKE